MQNIEVLPIREAIKLYLEGALVLAENADPRRLWPHRDLQNLCYELNRAIGQSYEKLRLRHGPV